MPTSGRQKQLCEYKVNGKRKIRAQAPLASTPDPHTPPLPFCPRFFPPLPPPPLVLPPPARARSLSSRHLCLCLQVRRSELQAFFFVTSSVSSRPLSLDTTAPPRTRPQHPPRFQTHKAVLVSSPPVPVLVCLLVRRRSLHPVLCGVPLSQTRAHPAFAHPAPPVPRISQHQ